MAGKSFSILACLVFVALLGFGQAHGAARPRAGSLMTLLDILSGPRSRKACDDYEPKECPDVDGPLPVFLPDDDDCTRFFECSNGEAIIKDCPPGLHFDRWNHVCDLPPVAGCEGCVQSGEAEADVGGDDDDDSDDESDSSSSEEEGDSSSEEDGDCPPEYYEKCPKVDGYDAVLLPDRVSCNSFILCSNGVAVRMRCPGNLVYNRELRVCDYPWRTDCVNCDGGWDKDDDDEAKSVNSVEENDMTN